MFLKTNSRLLKIDRITNNFIPLRISKKPKQKIGSSKIKMYGDTASKLIQEAKRAQNLDTIPSFASELVQSIIREMNQIDTESTALMNELEHLERIIEERASQGQFDADDIEDREMLESFGIDGTFMELSPEKKRQLTCALVVLRLCLLRNKRCLLAYQRLRANAIDKLAWEESDPLDSSITYNMSPGEQEYFLNYSELVVSHKGAYSEVDLTGPLEPPKDLFVDVRVLKDAGEIQTEYGYVFFLFKLNFEKFTNNSFYFQCV